MKARPAAISDVLILESEVLEDERGFFTVTYNARAFAEVGSVTFVQDNQSGSRQGVLRGLHYQIRQPQGKLVRVVRGEVFDVAVDLRKGSPTFGRWAAERVSADNRLMVWVPPGFAHGFYALSDWADVAYKVTAPYAPEWDRALLWNDPDVGIEWPLVGGKPPTLSPKDAAAKRLREAELFADV
jgi:dTDP-4-dehydrorhamnose 3,5-epimerase